LDGVNFYEEGTERFLADRVADRRGDHSDHRCDCNPQSFAGDLWFMELGAMRVHIEVNGPKGRAVLSVPVASFARQSRTMNRGLRGVFAFFFVFLTLSVVPIAGAVVRDSGAPPGTDRPASSRRSRTVMAIALIASVAVLHMNRNWWNAEACLRKGLRGLQGGSSLAKLLAEHRGVRNTADLPPLTEEQILNWADSHKAQTEKWPNQTSGPVNDAPGETWSGVNTALQSGGRGFPGGSSIVKILEEKRGIRNRLNLPPLTEEQIL